MRLFEGGQIRVNFHELGLAIGNIDKMLGHLNTVIPDLNASLDAKLSDPGGGWRWDGGAYGSYETTKLMWTNAAGQITENLTRIRGGLQRALERMAETEATNASQLSRG